MLVLALIFFVFAGQFVVDDLTDRRPGVDVRPASFLGMRTCQKRGGSASVGADDLSFQASQLPAGVPALLFAGTLDVNGGEYMPV